MVLSILMGCGLCDGVLWCSRCSWFVVCVMAFYGALDAYGLWFVRWRSMVLVVCEMAFYGDAYGQWVFHDAQARLL